MIREESKAKRHGIVLIYDLKKTFEQKLLNGKNNDQKFMWKKSVDNFFAYNPGVAI
jgi:hypothetical protein